MFLLLQKTLRLEGLSYRCGANLLFCLLRLKPNQSLRTDHKEVKTYFLDPAALAAPLSLARISSSFKINSSSSSILISVPLYLPKRTRSPALTSRGTRSPFSRRPAPTALTSPSCCFSFAESEE